MTNRPTTIQRRKSLSNFLETASLLLVVILIIIPIYFYPRLPERVPYSFGISGKPDAWSGRSVIFILPAVGCFLHFLLTIVNRYPRIFNYPVVITEQNRERQQYLAQSLIRWIKVEVLILLNYIQWSVIRVALGYVEGLGAGFLPLALLLILGTLGIYVYLARRSA